MLFPLEKDYLSFTITQSNESNISVLTNSQDTPYLVFFFLSLWLLMKLGKLINYQ